ncbi:DUF6934 family protein [Dyadobacter sp. 3J3]|uniref:DUF6934 family protein n=1 Tax=Dyadobacter sp. 3J3 TaxID=2606600 RepID=UPI00135C80B4|nr:hypothetical protein [Dyadobacter sp. 3J3]
MNNKSYPFRYNEDFTQFDFQSIGKRGVFEKAITFSIISENIYNLALMDFDPISQTYNDQSVTDNGDMPEILATVMITIIDFLNRYPERKIYLAGNSKSRTRLYQIAINKVLIQIKKDLIILGYFENHWIEFEPNRKFESFLIGRNLLD